MNNYIGRYIRDYELTYFLGSGSAAEVYLGKHASQENLVAIKLLNVRLPYDEEKVRLELESEALIVQILEHPHIIKIHDFGFDDMRPFLIMDYAPKGSLRRQHPKGSVLPLTTIVNYIEQIADALQYAHNKKIIHSDLKPENILLGENNSLLLSDFGTAQIVQTASSVRSLTTRRAEHVVAGTPIYMAPEQFKGEPDFKSDQYALGVIVYEWLCGSPPFQGKRLEELMYQHLDKHPQSLMSRDPMISPHIEEVVMKALSKEPKERFKNIQEFAGALEQANQSPVSIIKQYNLNEEYSYAIGSLHHITHLSQNFFRYSRISRRKVLVLGLGIVAGGLMTAYFLQQHSSIPPVPLTSPSLPGELVSVYRKHFQEVVGVAWSHDGKRIASASYDHTVQVWDATNGDYIYTYRGHNQRVTCVAWSPDGTSIASGGDDHTVQVWDATNGDHIYTYRGHSDNVHSVAWSPDSLRIASSSNDRTVRVWNARDGSNTLIHISPSWVWTAAWSPDGTRIASGNTDSTVHVWNARNGDLIFIYRLHSSSVHHVTWSPDGAYIASGGDDNSVQVWHAQNGKPITSYMGHNDKVWTAAWSHDSILIASGSYDKTVQVWNAQNGKLLFTYKAHSGGVASIEWSPTDLYIASGSWDHTVQVWIAPSLENIYPPRSHHGF